IIVGRVIHWIVDGLEAVVFEAAAWLRTRRRRAYGGRRGSEGSHGAHVRSGVRVSLVTPRSAVTGSVESRAVTRSVESRATSGPVTAGGGWAVGVHAPQKFVAAALIGPIQPDAELGIDPSRCFLLRARGQDKGQRSQYHELFHVISPFGLFHRPL